MGVRKLAFCLREMRESERVFEILACAVSPSGPHCDQSLWRRPATAPLGLPVAEKFTGEKAYILKPPWLGRLALVELVRSCTTLMN